MSVIKSGIRAEWEHLRQHKILLISCLVMFIIPILYGGFFLGSIWDPYGRTSDLPVAVVNDDQPTTLNGKQLNVGADIVDSLKSNHLLKWEFVSDDAAKKGIDNGHYYMAITIPNDFSAHIASVTSVSPSKATINYTVTPSKNYIGSLISNQAAEKVVTNAKQTITESYTSAIFAQLDTLKTGMGQAADGATQLADGTSQLSNGITTYTAGVSSLAGGQAQLNTGLAQLQNGSQQLASGLSQMNNQLPTADQVAQLQAGTTKIQQGLDSLNTQVKQTNPAVAKVSSDAATVYADITAFQTVAGSSQAAITNLATAAATAQTPTITVQTLDVAATLKALSAASKLATSTGTLLTDLNALSTSLAAQQQTLQSGVNQLATGMDQLAPQANAAFAGYNTLRTGASQLTAGSNQLTSGLSSAYTGSTQLVNGTNQLNANSPRLTAGANELNAGASTLASKLTDASQQLSIQPTGSATATQISAPVVGSETKKGDVPNYGFALAPYVLALGLYVGALVFCVIYPVRERFGQPRTAFQWFAGKWSTATLVGLGQVLVLAAVMVLVLGLHPADPIGFMVTLFTTSWTFMGIVLFLAITFNNPGRFLAMLLLVLQLGGSEGTFPIATTPGFFQAINGWLPMTYAIRALRQTISGDVGGVSTVQNVFIVFVIGFVAWAALYITFLVHKTTPFRHASVDGD